MSHLEEVVVLLSHWGDHVVLVYSMIQCCVINCIESVWSFTSSILVSLYLTDPALSQILEVLSQLVWLHSLNPMKLCNVNLQAQPFLLGIAQCLVLLSKGCTLCSLSAQPLPLDLHNCAIHPHSHPPYVQCIVESLKPSSCLLELHNLEIHRPLSLSPVLCIGKLQGSRLPHLAH